MTRWPRTSRRASPPIERRSGKSSSRECDKFDTEIDKEIRIKKFTAAELDEEEQNLERLQRWFRELRNRDLFRAPSHDQAERRLKECVERLEDFAEHVYEHGANA